MPTPSPALVAACLLLASPAVGQDTSPTKPKVAVVPIAMEAFTLKPGDALSARALVTRPAVLKDLRGWTLETYRHRGPVYATCYSPDGRLLATGGHDGMIRLWEVESRRLLKILVGHSGTVYLLEWSPDGKHLAAVGDSYHVTLWDTESGHPLRKLTHKFVLGAIAWSPDGTRLAGAGGHSGVTQIWEVTRGLEKHVIEIGQAVSALAWAPDGTRLAVTVPPIGVQIYDTYTGKIARPLGPPATPATRAAWSPDSKLVAATGKEGLLIWDAASGDLVRTIAGVFHLVEWSPDGKRLAAGHLNANVTLFDPNTGGPFHVLAAAAKRLTWAPDSKTLATGDDTTVSSPVASVLLSGAQVSRLPAAASTWNGPPVFGSNSVTLALR